MFFDGFVRGSRIVSTCAEGFVDDSDLLDLI